MGGLLGGLHGSAGAWGSRRGSVGNTPCLQLFSADARGVPETPIIAKLN